jgi:hypothetical protein
VRFTLNGQQFELTAKDVQDRLRAVSPEPVQEYGVQIGLVRYPVKQAFEAATGVSRRKFTTQVARRQLAALDFEIVATGRKRWAAVPPERNTKTSVAESSTTVAEPPASDSDWHTEARVQAMVVAYLT